MWFDWCAWTDERTEQVAYRFSGHETFPFRYAWLPKAYRALSKDPMALADEEQAMVTLGVGKNMVRATRFWVQAVGVAASERGRGLAITGFGEAILSEDGLDPYLEDLRTLWLIHWRLSTNSKEPLFAWDFMLSRWQQPEITRSAAVSVFQQEAERLDKRLSAVTLEQHFNVFLHTYFPTGSPKGSIREENLDCPLIELELIQEVGEKKNEGGRREPVYAFRLEEKPEIPGELFAYLVDDFWTNHRAAEKTLTLRDVSLSPRSPGQVLKLPEWAVQHRLEAIEKDSKGALSYTESAALQQITRNRPIPKDFLWTVYDGEKSHV